MSPFGLRPETWSQLLDGMAQAEYSLLLGAGASVGAIGGDGQTLGTAMDLANEIATRFSIGDAGDLTLGEIYDLARGRTDASGQSVIDFLKSRFSNCTPTWQTLLTEFRWRRLWSLNIDDVVEGAYRAGAGSARQQLRQHVWSDQRYADADSSRSRLDIIHLHGLAATLTERSENLVFSIREYLAARDRRHAWHFAFGAEFSTSPIIVFGCKLSQEFDLADLLSRPNESARFAGFPSFAVVRGVTESRRALLEKNGLIVVDTTAKEFIERLIQDRPETERRLAALFPLRGRLSLTPEATSFLQQFEWLRADARSAVDVDHDFFQGDDPLWTDVLDERDGPFELVAPLVSQADGALDSSSQIVICLVGPAGSGKSTTLLRIARELTRRRRLVWRFRGQERLDLASVQWWLRESPGTVLIFDDLSDHALDVGKLLDEARHATSAAVVIGSARPSRMDPVFENIAPSVLVCDASTDLTKLSDANARSVIAARRRFNRLGVLTQVPEGRQVEEFVGLSRRSLHEGLIQLEGGSGFLERIAREYRRDISSSSLRDVYIASCMTYQFGYPLPVATAASIGGVSVAEISKAIGTGGQLAGVLTVRQGLAPRHKIVASVCIDRLLTNADRFRVSVALAGALAPFVTPQTISRRTLAHRIIRRIMDEKLVVSWVGRDLISDWYAGLEESHGWNSRFWEQRALAMTQIGKYGPARSYAERACVAHRDSYSIHTLAVILFRTAVDSAHLPSDVREGMFFEAVDRLKESRQVGREREHPFISFFVYARRFLETGQASQTGRMRLLELWGEWWDAANRSPIFQHAISSAQIREYQRQWLHAIAADDARRH